MLMVGSLVWGEVVQPLNGWMLCRTLEHFSGVSVSYGFGEPRPSGLRRSGGFTGVVGGHTASDHSEGNCRGWERSRRTQHLPPPLGDGKGDMCPNILRQRCSVCTCHHGQGFRQAATQETGRRPHPPVASTPKGEKSQPAPWHTVLLCTTLSRSASAAAEDRPKSTADEEDERNG